MWWSDVLSFARNNAPHVLSSCSTCCAQLFLPFALFWSLFGHALYVEAKRLRTWASKRPRNLNNCRNHTRHHEGIYLYIGLSDYTCKSTFIHIYIYTHIYMYKTWQNSTLHFQSQASPHHLPVSLPCQVETWRVRKVMIWPLLPFEPELRHIYIVYLYTVYEL